MKHFIGTRVVFRRYTCVLFDFDNTLIDTDPLLREALELCGCPNVSDLSSKDLRAVSPIRVLQRLHPFDRQEVFWAYYLELTRTKSRLLDENTPAILRSLTDRGIRLGMATTNVECVVSAALEKLGVRDFFAENIVTYETCDRRKPHPDPILMALKMLGHPPEGTLYVGDSEKDALASRGAGVDFGFAAWAPDSDRDSATVKATRILNKLSDLLEYT